MLLATPKTKTSAITHQGLQCIQVDAELVVQSKTQRFVFILCPEYGYLPLENRFFSDDQFVRETEFSDFYEPRAGVWAARKIQIKSADPENPNMEKPLERITHIVKRLDLDETAKLQADEFQVDPPEGTKRIEPGKSGDLRSSEAAGSGDPRRAQLDAQLKGQIRWIEKTQGVVWINLGQTDGVARTMRFQVREKADPKSGNQPQAVKGTIEVSRIVDGHTSEARIILDDQNNALAKGDEIVQLFETTQPNDKPNEEQRKLPPSKGEIYDAARPGIDRLRPKQGSVSGAISGNRRGLDPALGEGLPTPPDKPTEGLPNDAQQAPTKTNDTNEETSGPTLRRGQETRAERERDPKKARPVHRPSTAQDGEVSAGFGEGDRPGGQGVG